MEDIIARLVSHKGVEGVIVCSYEGVVLKSTMSREESVQIAGLYAALASKCRSTVRTINTEVSGLDSLDWLTPAAFESCTCVLLLAVGNGVFVVTTYETGLI